MHSGPCQLGMANLISKADHMQYSIPFFLTGLLLVSVGCATTDFKPYEARVNSFEGKGGTKTVVAEMEIWDNGDPPRNYKILGIIEDERPGGPIPMASLKSDVVVKAKEVGGDAVIQLSNNS